MSMVFSTETMTVGDLFPSAGFPCLKISPHQKKGEVNETTQDTIDGRNPPNQFIPGGFLARFLNHQQYQELVCTKTALYMLFPPNHTWGTVPVGI